MEEEIFDNVVAHYRMLLAKVLDELVSIYCDPNSKNKDERLKQIIEEIQKELL